MNDPTNDIARGSSAMTGFVVGALVGAGIALLLAPASGGETRRRIGDAARRLGEDARERVDEARSTIGERVDQVRSTVKDRVDQARSTVSDLKEDARSAVDAGRDAFKTSRQSHSERSA